jgi:inhibitor of cysteine peptidase
MNWQPRLLAVVMLALFCGSAKAVTVRLTEADSSATVILHVSDRLRIELPTAPAAGYRWSAKKLDASHLETLSRDVRPDSGRLDAAGIQVFVWKAISPGHAEIGLEYSRPNEDRTVPPAKRIAIGVDIVAGELEPPVAGDGELLSDGPEAVVTYRGTLPCDGCLGIEVELTLDGVMPKAVKRFVERRRYRGASGGDRTIAGTGRLTVQHGTYADPSMTAYVLAAPDGSTENFKVDGDRLVLLDAEMLPVQSPSGRSIMLQKVPEAASGP